MRAARSGERWGLLILEGLVDLAAGAIAVIWPAITLVALVWIVAIWAIVSGALMLAAAFALNRDYGPWLLALGGIASLVFGILGALTTGRQGSGPNTTPPTTPPSCSILTATISKPYATALNESRRARPPCSVS